MRAAEAHRDAEALAGAEGDVGAHGARRLEQHQRHQVGGDGDAGALALRPAIEVGQVAHFAVVARVLQQGAENSSSLTPVDAGNDQFETEIAGAGLDHVDGLRAVGVDQEAVGLGLGDAAAMVIASAAAVASSSSEALAISRPVRSTTICWKFISASRRPWAISAW